MSLCLSLCALLQIYHFTWKQSGYDFYHLWIYGQAIRNSDVPNFYSKEFAIHVERKYLRKALKDKDYSRFKKAALWNARMNEEGHLPDATPLLYSSLSTISSGDYDCDLIIFQFASTLIFCLTIYAIGRALGNDISTVLIAISFLLLFWSPFHSDTEVANLARIQSGLLGTCILIWRYFDNRFAFILGGALLAISVLLKPNIVGVPISLAVVWFFRRRYYKLIFVVVGAFLGGLIALIYSAVYYGSLTCWFSWVQVLVAVQESVGPIEDNNLSLVCLIDHYFGINIAITIFLGLFFSFVLCCWLARRKHVQIHHTTSATTELIEDLLGMGAGLLMILMAYKIVWDHYLLLLAPVLFALISPVEIQHQIYVMKNEVTTRILSGILFFTFGLLPLRLLFSAVSSFDNAAIIGIASLTFWALLLFRIHRILTGQSHVKRRA